VELEYEFSEIVTVADRLIPLLKKGSCMAFYAGMGCGKTTLISSICKRMGVRDAVSSPTFSLVNEYLLPDGNKLYHMDWYRLKNSGDAFEAGIDDLLLEKDAITFIEWPEQAEALLPEQVIRVSIEITATQSRIIRWDA